jgi:hypothetical protein
VFSKESLLQEMDAAGVDAAVLHPPAWDPDGNAYQQAWWTDGTIDWRWPAAERAGVPVAFLAAGFLPHVAQVAERHPNLKLLIDHRADSAAIAMRRGSPTWPSYRRWAASRMSRSRRLARRVIPVSRTVAQHSSVSAPGV